MSGEKIKAVCNWSEPQKNIPWNFSKECQLAFNALKEAFTTAPILTHFIPGTQLTVETNALDYAIATGILSITGEDNQLCLVTFYSWTLSVLEFNYNNHDKELLAIFEAFQAWRHYLEGAPLPIDVVTDHKNLEYFSTSKVLTCQQAQWSKYLSQFNLVIHFCLERDRGYAQANPHNLQPVFMQEQLVLALCATCLEYPILCASLLMDVEQLHNEILAALPLDPLSNTNSQTPPILSDANNLWLKAIFIPTHNTITSSELAKLFLLHVLLKHGVLAHVTSDQGSEFVSHFFWSLGKTLEQYLWVYCNFQQNNWAKLLPLAEFAYNNAPSATTSVSPFFTNKGYHPNLSVFPKRDYAMDLDELHQLPAPEINLGNQVYVKVKYFQTTRPSQKLTDKSLGLYSVIAQPGTHSFTLHLLDSMCVVHPVFHVSQLELAHPNTIPNQTQPPPPPVKVNSKPEYEITKILDSKVDQ
ncbi:hypothetical protein M404DRAFT_30934 [Pisolithus tinctorius Marx 270]|uniref:Uncharacterized protein n=1 Tax=Pisolithus tinctorius Marx 270 TaxID=870435 RepID=A0A0C3IPV1_PISTI|nr:hypothetical protein M404DRAFT_30934 [Pisolithus tinctorius Marx 270]